MAFDECAPYPCEPGYAREAMERTHRWAERSLAARDPSQAFFGIVQGSTYPDLRAQSARFIASLDADGIAIGGVSVGEGKELMMKAVSGPCPPAGWKPRCLMGVGTPGHLDWSRAESTCSTASCPRLGRSGSLYTSRGGSAAEQPLHAGTRPRTPVRLLVLSELLRPTCVIYICAVRSSPPPRHAS
jgi:queuine tRNA-ribosyltransferase